MARYLATLFALFASLLLAYGSVYLYLLSPYLLGDVPLVVTVTTDRDHPDYIFFLVNWSGSSRVERLAVSPAEPARILPDGRTGAFRVWTLHAVRAGLLDPPAGSVPSKCGWFMQSGRLDEARSLGTFDFGGNYLPFYDDRDRIEVAYRLDRGPGGWRLERVAENAPDPLAKWCRVVAATLALVGFAALWLWWVRRWMSRRHTCTTPVAELLFSRR